MLSMASVLEKTKKTRRRVFVEVVTASTKISFTDYTNFMRKITAFIILTGELEIRYISRCRVVLLKLISSYDKQEYHKRKSLLLRFNKHRSNLQRHAIVSPVSIRILGSIVSTTLVVLSLNLPPDLDRK